jgi:predicted nucleic-acid-binding protein
LRIAVDTNVLVRAVLDDDTTQAAQARSVLVGAELIAIPTGAFCELVWVLRRGYGFSVRDVSDLIRTFLNIDRVVVDRPAVEAGLRMLDTGGDFADGAIHYAGQWLGGDVFLSFDRDAIHRLVEQGHRAETPGAD